MLKKIDGIVYTDMLKHGIKNIEKHRGELNALNVFPVPDGDTGTNMLMTLRYGYEAIKRRPASIADASRAFASSAVFGARGNSGVIVSQFFKGMSDAFEDSEEADCELLSKALTRGSLTAYAAVAEPVEGTILTVVKDAARELSRRMPTDSIEELLDIYLGAASESLKRTPELLPVLKKANVVDSGGSGILYFFEGVRKYLAGESIESGEGEDSFEAIDLTRFNKDTDFEYGYCVEGLIQLTIDEREFDAESFRQSLTELGESVVLSLEGDKVKIHAHSKKPGDILNFCQSIGEMLTVKIENMTVQNLGQRKEENEQETVIYSKELSGADFSVIAVAPNSTMRKKFLDIGADVVIVSEIVPSLQNFLDAFARVGSGKILLFPNSSNSVMTAEQAAEMYKDAEITVLNSRTCADCYAALSMIDFGGDVKEAIATADDAIKALEQVSVHRATKNIRYGSKTVAKGEYFALRRNKILSIGNTLEGVIVDVAARVAEEREYFLVTIFHGRGVSEDGASALAGSLAERLDGVEVGCVSTMEASYDVTLNFE